MNMVKNYLGRGPQGWPGLPDPSPSLLIKLVPIACLA